MNFLQVLTQFQSITSLQGIAVFDAQGDMVDTNLPIADNLCEEIGARFLSIVSECHEADRFENEFLLEYGENILFFAEYGSGSLMFILEDSGQLDQLVSLYRKHYKGSKVEEIVSLQPVAVSPEFGLLYPKLEKRSKKNPALLVISGLTVAIALAAAAVPSTFSEKSGTAPLVDSSYVEIAAQEELAEQERLESEKKVADLLEKLEQEKTARIAAQELAEKEEQQRLAVEKLAMQKAEEEKLAALKLEEEAKAAQQALEEKLAAERAEKEKLEAEIALTKTQKKVKSKPAKKVYKSKKSKKTMHCQS